MRRIYILICFISIFFFGVTPADATTITTLHQWNFYNDAFVVEDRDTIAHEEVTIPHRWGNFFGDKNGYGTYVTTLQFDKALIGELYTLYIPYAATAYTLYFNGIEQVRMGTISTTEKGFSPQQKVKLHQFTVPATEIVVALQVANFSNMVGGAERAILVGPSDSMIKYYQSEKNREHFILGCFLFMVINMFSLYYFRRQETSYLWVGLIGLFLILWYVFSKDHLIMDIFPNLSWEWMTKLELLIVFLAFAFYNKYISVAYKNYYNQQIPLYSFATFGILLVLCFVLPVSSIVILFNISSVLIIFFALHVAYMSYRSLRDKQPYARAIVLTNLAFFVPFIQDMFYIQGFINTNYYSIYGFMFFSFGYLVMLNFEHTKKYRESEMYNLALTEINQALEETVEERTRELREKNHQLELLTVRDGLTNIANRRYFDEQLAAHLRKVKLHDELCSLILFDIDFFKQYNDYYGHADGDEVLKKIAHIATICVGDDGIVARYGGEEFAVIVPNKTLKEAYVLAQFLRESIENERMPHRKSDVYGVVTVSVGVAQATDICDAKGIIVAADAALYSAKHNGRNQVCTAKELNISENLG